MKKNLIFFLPNFSKGGAAKSIVNICKNLNKTKYNIYIISLQKNSYKKELSKYCKKIYEINISKTIFSYKYILKNILKKFDKKHTIFISNINYTNILSLFFLKVCFSYKVVITERTPIQELDYYYSIFNYFKKKMIKILMYILYRKADLIICNAKKISNDLFKSYSAKAEYVYPILENKIKKNTRNKKSTPFCVLSVGRYAKEKKLQDIIKAVSLLHDKKIKLILLGSGPQKHYLTKLIKELNINAKLVRFSEKLEKKYLRTSDLYINSSDFEGFPNVVVAAINNSVPVIATKSHGGINEILYKGNGGLLYNQGNILDLSKKILFIKKNYNQIIKKIPKAHNKLDRFLFKNTIIKFEKLIDRIN